MKNSIFNAVCKTRYLALLVVLIFTCGNVWGDDYKLITATNDLVSGCKYLIGTGKTNGTQSFVSTESRSNNRGVTTGTVSSSIVTKTAAMMALTLGGSTGEWTFQTNDYLGTAGYLNATSTTSNNYLKVATTNDNYRKFSISFSSDAAIITCTGKSSRNVVRYNSSNNPPIITCYSSGYSDVYLYRQCFSITYNCDGADSGCPSNATGQFKLPNPLPSAPTKAGYTFDGWYTNSTKTTAAVAGATLTANTTLYAKWVSSGCSNKVNITAGTPESGGAFTLDKTGEQDCCSELTVTVSGITAPTGKRFSAITQTGIATGVTIDQNAKTVTYAANSSGNSTINVTFEALPTYTVSFSTGTGNPQQADISETVGGEGITLPAGPTPSCSTEGWSFAGWGYESCDETSDEPYLYFPGNTYYPDDDETLYAVYVQDKTPTNTYVLLEKGAQVAADENYVITATADDKAIKSEVYQSYYIEAADVTVEEAETDYHITSPNNQLIWKMGKNGSTISLYNATDENYLKIYETGGHHNLALDASEYTFTLSEVRGESGYVSTFKMESTNDPGYLVIYSTDNDDFTATNHDDYEDTELYLYKQMNTGTYNSNPICCDNKVTFAHNSPSNGTVSFAPAGPIETCEGTVNTTMTITPAAGYTLTAFNYSTGSGTVSPSNQSPGAPDVTLNSATQQAITLTFAQNANGTCTANATFSAIVPTAWSWTYNSAAIPNPINLYIGQTAALVATYTPAGNLLLSTEKNYDVVKSDGLTQVSKTYAVPNPTYTFRADAVMDDGTIVLTNHNHTSLTTTVHVHVDPLPKVHFVDIIHGYDFSDVAGTIEDNALVSNKTTPTHDEFSGTGANDCETYHTRLVGWILSTWADEHPNATTSEIIDAGTGVYFDANTTINVLTYDGNTYYAVWAKLQ